MKYIENVEVFGWNAALRGMRNPKNSWNKADSILEKGEEYIGPNDMRLAQALNSAGPEHRKFLRMIHVQFDVTLPRYVWSEFDTYHHNVKNSCSTMHKLFVKGQDIKLEDFIEPEEVCQTDVLETYNFVITKLNKFKDEYFNTPLTEGLKRDRILRAAKQILPEGWLQKRTVDTTYEELKVIYHQRKNHRLPEWRAMLDELMEQLPYATEFITGE